MLIMSPQLTADFASAVYKTANACNVITLPPQLMVFGSLLVTK